LIEDATNVFTAMPDYVLIFKKDGENEAPVTHEGGLKEYFGELPLLPFQMKGVNDDNDFVTLSRNAFSQLQKKYWNFEGDHKENKLSHMIFRRYMNSVWDDIRIDNVLPFRDGKDEDDEKTRASATTRCNRPLGGSVHQPGRDGFNAVYGSWQRGLQPGIFGQKGNRRRIKALLFQTGY
jgi:hypothetical protein